MSHYVVMQVMPSIFCLWFIYCFCSIEIKGDEQFLLNGTQSNLHVESLGHVVHAFVNGKLSGDICPCILKSKLDLGK